MTVSDLKELSPFLAVIVSIMALTVGPFIAGRIARAQDIASMREKWIYSFRDCLAELITELDVLHETCHIEGLPADKNYKKIIQKLRLLINRARLMANTNEPLYVELLEAIEQAIDVLVTGIEDFDEFHKLNDKVKHLAQQAIRREWQKIAPLS